MPKKEREGRERRERGRDSDSLREWGCGEERAQLVSGFNRERERDRKIDMFWFPKVLRSHFSFVPLNKVQRHLNYHMFANKNL